jgi:Family of unknown function (DUF5670)
MFGIIAGVLIVLWLLGFLAFHVTSGLIHIVLVIGLILLVVHSDHHDGALQNNITRSCITHLSIAQGGV